MTAGEQLADLGEDSLVARLLSRYRPSSASPDGSGVARNGDVLVGPGDDAAVLALTGRVVVTTDTLVEGHDFRRDWSTARDVGVKAVAQNAADVVAMGGRPIALVVSVAMPGDLRADWAVAFADGLEAECQRAGATVIGGDVATSTDIVVTGTALGLLDDAPVLRSGAQPGDVIALAGRTGPSAAGLALLSAFGSKAAFGSSWPPQLRQLVRLHCAPQPPYLSGPQAARAGATAMTDTSDGLLRDAARIAAASAVTFDLDPERLAPGEDLLSAARALGDESLALTWVLSGGEDHCLVACFKPDAVLPASFVPIGRVLDGPVLNHPGSNGRVLLAGQPWQGPTGWRHFS